MLCIHILLYTAAVHTHFLQYTAVVHTHFTVYCCCAYTFYRILLLCIHIFFTVYCCCAYTFYRILMLCIHIFYSILLLCGLACLFVFWDVKTPVSNPPFPFVDREKARVFKTDDAVKVLECHKPVQATYFGGLQEGCLSSNGTPSVATLAEDLSPGYGITQSSTPGIR